MKIFFQAEAPKAARKKKIRLLPNRGYPRTTTVNIPHKTASVLYLNAVNYFRFDAGAATPSPPTAQERLGDKMNRKDRKGLSTNQLYHCERTTFTVIAGSPTFFTRFIGLCPRLSAKLFKLSSPTMH